MSKDFQNVRMMCREVPDDALVVEQGEDFPDRLFFDINEGANVYLSAPQVRELTRRMTVWLEALDAGDDNLWEDA